MAYSEHEREFTFAKKHAAFMCKGAILGFAVSPGSAEAQVR